SGATIAITQADGTFALVDKHYNGGQIRVSAEVTGEPVITGVAFESNPQDSTAPAFVRKSIKNIATVNLTFPAIDTAPPAPTTDLTPFVVGANGALTPLDKNAPLVTAGSTVAVKI